MSKGRTAVYSSAAFSLLFGVISHQLDANVSWLGRGSKTDLLEACREYVTRRTTGCVGLSPA